MISNWTDPWQNGIYSFYPSFISLATLQLVSVRFHFRHDKIFHSYEKLLIKPINKKWWKRKMSTEKLTCADCIPFKKLSNSWYMWLTWAFNRHSCISYGIVQLRDKHLNFRYSQGEQYFAACFSLKTCAICRVCSNTYLDYELWSRARHTMQWRHLCVCPLINHTH